MSLQVFKSKGKSWFFLKHGNQCGKFSAAISKPPLSGVIWMSVCPKLFQGYLDLSLYIPFSSQSENFVTVWFICHISKCLECCFRSRFTHALLRSGPRSSYNILCDSSLELPPLGDLLNTFQSPEVLLPKGWAFGFLDQSCTSGYCLS